VIAADNHGMFMAGNSVSEEPLNPFKGDGPNCS